MSGLDVLSIGIDSFFSLLGGEVIGSLVTGCVTVSVCPTPGSSLSPHPAAPASSAAYRVCFPLLSGLLEAGTPIALGGPALFALLVSPLPLNPYGLGFPGLSPRTSSLCRAYFLGHLI